MAGRKPVPTKLKQIRGTDQPCRINPDEPSPDADNLEAPEFLSPQGLEAYEPIKCALEKAQIMTDVDTHAVAMLAEAVTSFEDATSKVRSQGIIVLNPKTGAPMQNPYFKASNVLQKQIVALLADLGMNPSARTRVSKVTKPEEETKDPWQQLGRRSAS